VDGADGFGSARSRRPLHGSLGLSVTHIKKSKVYYDPATDTGAAIFVTWDDAQATFDHVHQHRTPLLVISPFAKPGYVAKRHYSTASIDRRRARAECFMDMFQAIAISSVPNRSVL
jgi:hypothetical protein